MWRKKWVSFDIKPRRTCIYHCFLQYIIVGLTNLLHCLAGHAWKIRSGISGLSVAICSFLTSVYAAIIIHKSRLGGIMTSAFPPRGHHVCYIPGVLLWESVDQNIIQEEIKSKRNTGLRASLRIRANPWYTSLLYELFRRLYEGRMYVNKGSRYYRLFKCIFTNEVNIWILLIKYWRSNYGDSRVRERLKSLVFWVGGTWHC